MPLPISSAAVSNAPTMAFSVTGVIEQNKGEEVAVKLTESEIFPKKKYFAKRNLSQKEMYRKKKSFEKRRLLQKEGH